MRADEIEIEAPCDEDWDRMRPEAGGRRRWCDHCERSVHDLSKMSEPAARAFMREHGDRVCIAYFEDEAGKIVFAPEPSVVPLGRVTRRPRPLAEAAKLASAASFAALLGACTPHGQDAPAIRIDDAESTPVVAPITVIPTVTAEPPARATEVIAPPAAEQPCDPPSPPRDRPVKGKPRRTMGLLLVGVDNDPLGGL